MSQRSGTTGTPSSSLAPRARERSVRPAQTGGAFLTPEPVVCSIARSVADLTRLRAGEVLVCPATNSAWMMVFARAGALVADYGSVLSHTAIVAREHGLPAVVATGDATQRLRDGDEVIVDGNRGTVTRCRDA